MPIYPGATWRPISVNYSSGGGQAKELFIVHVMQGSLWGTDAWFRKPEARASAHFGVAADGTCFQWVDTASKAWHACSANGRAIGVETEGFAGTALTSQQVARIADILLWSNRRHPGIDLWLNRRPNEGSGLSYHGLGGAAWCNHPSCPGPPRVSQLPAIVKLARSRR